MSNHIASNVRDHQTTAHEHQRKHHHKLPPQKLFFFLFRNSTSQTPMVTQRSAFRFFHPSCHSRSAKGGSSSSSNNIHTETSQYSGQTEGKFIELSKERHWEKRMRTKCAGETATRDAIPVSSSPLEECASLLTTWTDHQESTASPRIEKEKMQLARQGMIVNALPSLGWQMTWLAFTFLLFIQFTQINPINV